LITRPRKPSRCGQRNLTPQLHESPPQTPYMASRRHLQTSLLRFEIPFSSSTTDLPCWLPLSLLYVLNMTPSASIPLILVRHAPSVSCAVRANFCLPLLWLAILHVKTASMSLVPVVQPLFAASAARSGCQLTPLGPYGSPPDVFMAAPALCPALNLISGLLPPVRAPTKLMI
jgi:hypothetical protein